MQTNFRGRDLIGDLDFTKEEVETVLDVAWDLKRKRALGEPHAYLRDKVLAMLFFFSSTRTRGSFEAGWHNSVGMAHSSIQIPPRFHTAIRLWKLARSSVVISMALPFVTVTLAMATNI